MMLCPETSRHIATCTEGVSLLPLMNDPSRQWKSAAFSQYPRMLIDGDIIMGYRLRNIRYSYTEWRFYDSVQYTPIWTKHPRGVELYDHNIDTDENINRALDPKYTSVVKKLSKELREGWRKSLPPK